LIIACLLQSSYAQNTQENVTTDNRYLNLSIEELTDLNVTAVSGVTETWFRSPAAVYLITQDDIQRTGHQSIAELLRLVPGVNVAQVSSNSWTVGTRGIQGNFTDSMLMLVDGRSVYDPLQFVIRWDTQDMVLEDIQNIEVIRGPGTTLWGSNAVNGVVSLTTKSAKDTQGWLFNSVVGNHDLPTISLRYGDKIDDNMHFRIWSKYANRGALTHADGSDAPDDWNMFRTGFRLDVEAPDALNWSIQGGFYHSDHLGGDSRIPDPTQSFTTNTLITDSRVTNGYLQATFSQQASEQSKWTVMSSYERSIRATHDGFESQRDVIELDYRHRLAIHDDLLLIWGASWQYSADSTEPSIAVTFEPQDMTTNLFTGFIQNSIQFMDDKLALVLGSKFEHNDYTGFEYHPSARLSWTPDINNTIWASVSRAVRTPGRVNSSAQITPFYADTGLLAHGPESGIIIPLTIGANGKKLESEKLFSYELGYRTHLSRQTTIDACLYFNDYTQLITSSQSTFGQLNNNLGGEVIGMELSTVWTPAPTFRMEAGYSYCRSYMHGENEGAYENSYPANQFHLRSYLDIGQNLELNGALYYVDQIENQQADSYLRMDVGLTWHITPNIDVSFWGQNLLDNQHAEFFDSDRSSVVSEIPSSFYARINMTF
jgi:iron complex outermembrane receptor protein